MEATQFWNGFVDKSVHWTNDMLSGKQRGVFEELDTLLQLHDVPFCFDITCEERACILIFSPEGDSEMAKAIDHFVGIAPNLEGWSILRRRPQKGACKKSCVS